MKILLLGFVRIAHMPYMNDYVSLLGGAHELHLISWNRNGEEDAAVPVGVDKSFVFSDHVEDEDPMKEKLPHFLRYRKFALGIIDREKYDRIVVLHSTPGITIFNRLRGQYRGKYILDYRDVSHENYRFYRKLILELSQNAGLVLASSPSYMKYLHNEGGVFLKHNLLKAAYDSAEFNGCHFESRPIRVRYWGMIRHETANRAMIDALGGDSRFELHYNGREEEVAKRLKEYVAKRGFSNVYFHGSYYPEERVEFAKETDIVHNVYENDFMTVGAMGNKFYDALQFRLPQICTKGSIMGDVVEAKGLGLAVDYASESLSDSIFKYFNRIDEKSLSRACEAELALVDADNTKADEAILSYFGGE